MAVVGVLGVCAPDAALAQPRAAGPAVAKRGVLSGTVVDAATGSPLAHVKVVVGSPALGEPSMTETDEAGRYARELSSGPVVVAFTMSGYAVERSTVAVPAGETATLDVRLVPRGAVLPSRGADEAGALATPGAAGPSDGRAVSGAADEGSFGFGMAPAQGAPPASSVASLALHPTEDARRRSLYERWLVDEYGSATSRGSVDLTPVAAQLAGGGALVAGGIALSAFCGPKASDDANDQKSLATFCVLGGIVGIGGGAYLMGQGFYDLGESLAVEEELALPAWDAALVLGPPTSLGVALVHRY